MPRDVSLAEVVQAGTEAHSEAIHTSIVAEVVTYYPITQSCDVKVMVKRPLQDVSGDITYERYNNIPNVPLCFPRAGGFVFTFPVAAGDSVLLVFSETAFGEWRLTGQLSEPEDTRRHSIGYPVAIPGLFPNTKPLASGDTTARSNGMVLGKDGEAQQIRIDTFVKLGATATDLVALSTPTAANFAALVAAVNAGVGVSNTNFTALVAAFNALVTVFNAHTHAYVPGPPAATVPSLGPSASASAAASPTAASNASAPTAVAATLVKAL